jgi:hypothetical protein
MRTSIALLAVLLPSQAWAQLGGQGESCRASSDCESELACVAEICDLEPPPDDPSSHWIAFQPTGPRFFVGFTIASGPVVGGSTGNLNNLARAVDAGFLPAVHAGVLLGRHELRLELSTFWYVPDVKGRGPVFETMASYAYLIPLYDIRKAHISWPLRGGIGVLAGGYTAGDLVWLQLEADLVGVAIRLGHIILDFHVPSFRYAVTDHSGTQGHLFSWLVGASFSYVF